MDFSTLSPELDAGIRVMSICIHGEYKNPSDQINSDFFIPSGNQSELVWEFTEKLMGFMSTQLCLV